MAALFGLLFIAGCAQSSTPIAANSQPAASHAAATGQLEVQTLPMVSDYYYLDGERAPLTPSFDWISVRFVSDDPLLQADILKKYDDLLQPLDQARNIPHPEMTLLRLQEGIPSQEFAELLNMMRADKNSFLLANPLFYTAETELAMTDEFIATFPAGKSLAEIDEINSMQGVELVSPILGQENTFVLRVAGGGTQDALSMANYYQESGLALHAAPNFIQIKIK